MCGCKAYLSANVLWHIWHRCRFSAAWTVAKCRFNRFELTNRFWQTWQGNFRSEDDDVDFMKDSSVAAAAPSPPITRCSITFKLPFVFPWSMFACRALTDFSLISPSIGGTEVVEIERWVPRWCSLSVWREEYVLPQPLIAQRNSFTPSWLREWTSKFDFSTKVLSHLIKMNGKISIYDPLFDLHHRDAIRANMCVAWMLPFNKTNMQSCCHRYRHRNLHRYHYR